MPRWSMTASALGECHLGVMVTRPADAASWGSRGRANLARLQSPHLARVDSGLHHQQEQHLRPICSCQIGIGSEVLRIAAHAHCSAQAPCLSLSPCRSSLFVLLSLRFSSSLRYDMAYAVNLLINPPVGVSDEVFSQSLGDEWEFQILPDFPPLAECVDVPSAAPPCSATAG